MGGRSFPSPVFFLFSSPQRLPSLLRGMTSDKTGTIQLEKRNAAKRREEKQR